MISYLAQKSKEYFRNYKREYRKIEKQIGERYRAWEHMPGESYTDFKKRLKSQKLLTVICLLAAFAFQMPTVWT